MVIKVICVNEKRPRFKGGLFLKSEIEHFNKQPFLSQFH